MSTVKVIVGFVKRLCDLDDLKGFASSEAKALYELQRAPAPGFVGLVAIVRRILYINATYVEVRKDDLSEFLLACQNWDPVDYCDLNHPVFPVGYANTVPAQYQIGSELRSVLLNHHLPTPDSGSPYGLGIRIGLIDSGIAPHPYLPALSSAELSQKLSTFHASIPKSHRRGLCASIGGAEHAAGVEGIGLDKVAGHSPPSSGNGPATPIYARSDLGLKIDAELASYQDGLWHGWKQDITQWLSRQRQPRKPPLPTYRALAGAIRLVSGYSRNFVDAATATGILDVDGHGTQIAGILSALRPSLSEANPQRQIDGTADHPLMESVAGLCPYAELVVLKCFHRLVPGDEALVNGSLFTIVDALEHASELRLDILYIGLAAYDITYPDGEAVRDFLKQLHDKGTVIIAPAGNKAKPELAFPAGVSAVDAITAIAVDAQSRTIQRCDYSSYASKQHT